MMGAVAVPDPMLAFEAIRLVAQVFLECPLEKRYVIGVNALQPFIGPIWRLVFRQPENGAPARRAVEAVCGQVKEPKPVVGASYGRLISFLASVRCGPLSFHPHLLRYRCSRSTQSTAVH